MYLVKAMYVCMVCFASNSLQLIFSFSAINVALLSSVACALQLTFPATVGQTLRCLYLTYHLSV